MRNFLLFSCLLITLTSYADDESLGRAKADSLCSLCHGPQGLAILPNAPNLAGQQPIYLSEQLKNYRSGKRPNEVMGVIAKNLTDSDISQLVEWYSSIKVTVELP